MSSDNFIDEYHRNSSNFTGPNSTQTNFCDINSTIKRRKSSTSTITPLSLSVAVDNQNDDDDSLSTSQILSSSSTSNPIGASSQQQYNSGSISSTKYSYNGGNNGITSKTNLNASPSRYLHHNDGIYLQLNNTLPNCNRLSIHHPNTNDRFDQEVTTCCLPPPSPAPNSDRFIMGMLSPSIANHNSQHYNTLIPTSDQKFSALHHRSMSPTSR